MTDDEPVTGLENTRNTMIAVATGGPRINEGNDQYQRTFATVTESWRADELTIRLPTAVFGIGTVDGVAAIFQVTSPVERLSAN